MESSSRTLTLYRLEWKRLIRNFVLAAVSINVLIKDARALYLSLWRPNPPILIGLRRTVYLVSQAGLETTSF